MSIRYSLAQRTPTQNGLFAALACAITLALTAGPALAEQPVLERVEISGRVIEAAPRLDVRATCRGIDEQLAQALQTTWVRERQAGDVRVNMLMDGDAISGVQARGISPSVARAVRNAVQGLDCGPQAATGAQLYRFTVAFIDPYSVGYRGDDTRATAQAQPVVRLAVAKR